MTLFPIAYYQKKPYFSMEYIVQQLDDGRILLRDTKNKKHLWANTPKTTQTFYSLDDWFDWVVKNTERLKWLSDYESA